MASASIKALQAKKEAGQKLTMLTAYDAPTAKLLASLEIDAILVGDSLGNNFAGFETTIPVTMAQMLYHTACVSRGAKDRLIIADMPFLSYEINADQAIENAGRLIKESGANAVKIEVSESQLTTVRRLTNMGVPVIGHIGFTPQSLYQLGGYKIQGKSKEDRTRLLTLSKDLEDAGCFAVLFEMVPSPVARSLTKALRIPTFGIGAGPDCDGQVMVTQDVVGLNNSFKPKFVKHFANGHDLFSQAIAAFKEDVESGTFPGKEHSFE